MFRLRPRRTCMERKIKRDTKPLDLGIPRERMPNWIGHVKFGSDTAGQLERPIFGEAIPDAIR